MAITKSILLVNFGKKGVRKLFQDLEKESGSPLADLEFTLKGTLIYGEGKTVFELTDKQASILDSAPLKEPYFTTKTNDLGEQSVYGEIIDPKCYFGVMKPGFGKVHRSCAIRCIAGGISPVMVTKNAEGNKQFILLVANESSADGYSIARLAGKLVSINGQLKKMDDWLVLNYDEQQLAQAQNQKLFVEPALWDVGMALCN